MLYHPWFWGKEERIKFIFTLQCRMKEWKIDLKALDRLMCIEGTYGNEAALTWPESIPEGLYKAIYEKTDVAPYNKPIDIVRYVISAFRHVNEIEYAKHRTHLLERSKVEDQMREIFPKLQSVHYSSVFWSMSAKEE